MEWTNEQKNAIYLKNKNILVAAAAGSGKTAVLVERIINKIINEHVDIDKILVVTFTNAAASEMRERILKAIYEKQEQASTQEEEDNLQKQIMLLNKASICTIDSFCLDVIRNNFYELDITPNFRIADTAEMELLKHEVLEELFEEKYESQNENFEKLIKTYTSYRDDTPLKDLILKIHTYIEASPFPKEWLQEQIEKFNIQDVSQDFAKTVWGKLLLKDVEEELIDGIATLKSHYLKLSVDKDLEKFAQMLKNNLSQLETLNGNLDSWDKSFEIANNIDFGRWPTNKILSEAKEKAKEARADVKKKFDKKRDKIFTSKSEEANKDILDMYEVLSKLKDVILEFDEKLFKKKKEKNILDFSDIEHLALKILIKNENGKIEKTDVAKMYTNKFSEIAIDEYQDSNLVQEYILTAVSNGNNIFMVGDVKQSIYKFRQAMPELFLSKYKNYKLAENGALIIQNQIMNNNNSDEKQLGNNELQDKTNFENESYVESRDEKNCEMKDLQSDKGLKIQLFKNFRSRKNVLDFTNIIFKNIMSENLGDIDYTEEEYLNLGADYKESKEDLKTEIDIIDVAEVEEEKSYFKDDDESNEEDEEKEELEKVEDIELEARYVSKKIKELVESKFQIYDNKKQVFRDIKYKDIVILLRSTKFKAPVFEKQLVKDEIPVFSDTSSEYLDSFEIKTIMSLLKIIDNPLQDIPLVMVMRSSIGKFTDNDLLEIRLHGGYEDFYTSMQKAKLSVSQDLRNKIEEFLGNVEKWRNEKNYVGLDELIWNIYEDTGFLNYVEVLPNGALRKANLQMLFERAKQYESVSFKGLFNFINFIEKISSSSGDLGSAKLIGENEDVVRIMSIHKSKGLEFPVVFLSGTGTGFNLMDLNNDILLHQDLGIGVKYIDYDMQIKYDTLSKMALKNKLYEETLSEEMRVLYVALTRAKEKIFITGISKNYTDELEKMKNLVDMYKMENGKINPVLIKKYKKYLDWIMLVYLYNEKEIKDFSVLNVIKKEELISVKDEEVKKEIDVEALISDCLQTVDDSEVQKLREILAYEYPYLDSTQMPTKTSVTAIVHKNVLNKDLTLLENNEAEEINRFNQDEIFDEQLSEDKFELTFPRFLVGTEEEKISPAKKGTLVHLCMKNLDFSRDYTLDDVKELIDSLCAKKIITEKERDSINPWDIFKFTKTEIFESLKTAKEVHKEEAFYINVEANKVTDLKADDMILAQGVIDLYFIDKDDNLVLLDYKTDFAREGDEQILIDRHKEQLYLYRDALESALERKVDRVFVYSVALGKVIKI